MNLNPKITLNHVIYAAVIAVIALLGWQIVESRKNAAKLFNSEFVVQTEMPTAEESIRWALLETGTKYFSFEPVRTNVTFAPKKVTYGGRYDADRERLNEQIFGSAYDQHDSFTRTESNWVCELTITHAKSKPPNKYSKLLKDEFEEVEGITAKGYTNTLFGGFEVALQRKYSHYDILRTGLYRVTRIEGGQLMKPVNTANGIGYVWDNENRDKFSSNETWVYFIEAGNLQEK